jgi:cytochrome c553
MTELLPWERLLWSGRPWRLVARVAGERYLLTDFRLLRITRAGVDELALDDVGEIQRFETALDRLFGTSTIVVHRAKADVHDPTDVPDPPNRPDLPGLFQLTSIRRGAQLAALLELLAGDPRAPRDPASVHAALAWDPRPPAFDLRGALGGFVALLLAIVALVFGLRGKTVAVTYAKDDALAPNGEKRTEADIVRFMEADVMPWARATLGRLKGGADRVTCATCHGADAAARGWRMPAVAALPQPDVRDRGWEIYTTKMDAQMRNAIYGYLAESENQAKAAYMREVVVPGMARLLHRPAYDFTRSYEFNRSQRALGCYHCHQVQ